LKFAYKDPGVNIEGKTPNVRTVIKENSVQELRFNVLENRPVEEKLTFKKFIIEDDRIETYFDRSYRTDMAKSPDHYIFLSGLVNLQKMIYVLMCNKFDFSYKKNDKEKLKIWPISVDVKMNGLIRKKKDLMQDFELINIEKISDTKYHISGKSSSESALKIKGSALVYLI